MEKLNFKNLSYYKNKKILVTGNTGFKGSWLSIWLIKLGAKVYGISKNIPTKPSLFKESKLDKKMTTYFIDIKDFIEVRKKIDSINPQIIFHLAAQSIVSKSFLNPMETYFSNSIGTANVLEYLRTTKKKISAVIITSDKCYYPNSKGYYNENSKLGGIDPYSGSKAIAELFFENYYKSFLFKKRNISCVSVRAGNVIGGGDWTINRVIPDIFKSIIKKQNIILRNPKSNRPWQHVLEPLSAYLFIGMLMKTKKKLLNGQSFNIGPNIKSNASVLRLVKKILVLWGDQKKIFYKKKKLFAESNKLNLNTNKIFKAIGWKSKLNFDETCYFISDWYKDYLTNKRDAFQITKNQIKKYTGI